MTAQKPERDGYEAAMEARVAAWQAALDAYRAAKAIDGSLGEANLGPGIQSTAPQGVTFGAFDLPVGALRTKSVPDAIKLYLSAGRRKQTNKEIAAGLRQGGLETTAGNFEANIAAALFRLKKAGLVLRFKDGWDLAEHYPDHIRNKLENGAKPKATSGKKAAPHAGKKGRRREQQKKAAEPSPKTAKSTASAGSVEEAIALMLDDRKTYSPKTIAIATGKNPASVRKKLQEMLNKGKIQRGHDGTYGLAVDAKGAG